MIDIVLASNFPLEMIRPSLDFWLDTLELPLQVRFEPGVDLLHALHHPHSALSTNQDGINILLLTTMEVRRRWDRLQAALPLTVPHVVIVVPDGEAEYRPIEPPPGLVWIGPDAVSRLCPLAALLHPQPEYRTMLPYSPVGYTALATVVMRQVALMVRPPFKVLAMDADQTLWGGVCSEVGPAGVVLDGPWRRVHETVIRLQQAGLIVAVCSHNDIADVQAVFARPDMTLTPSHIGAWKVDQRPKAEHLVELSTTMGLPLESFLFVDDDPLEVARVQAALPAVTALRMPAPGVWLANLWAFDTGPTAEGGWRTAAYHAHASRERSRAAAPDVETFLSQLNLSIRTSPVMPHQEARLVELTERTNQMNFNPRPMTAATLAGHRQAGWHWLATHVRDRFGDYGLVGASAYRIDGATMDIDAFMVSCRALRRGVEHRMVRELGRIAAEMNCTTVVLRWRPTGRNGAAEAFMRSLPVELTAAAAQSVEYRLDTEPQAAAQPASPVMGLSAATYERIATELGTLDAIHAAAQQRVKARPHLQAVHRPPVSPQEVAVVRVFEELLGISGIGLNDSFWELGGYSLLAVQLLSRVQSDTGLSIPISIIFHGRLSPAELLGELDQIRSTADPRAAVLATVADMSDAEVAALLERLN